MEEVSETSELPESHVGETVYRDSNGGEHNDIVQKES